MERDLEFVENRVRLRHDEKIVGYKRSSGNSEFYSKDGFWWRGIKIPHLQQDACSGFKDKNNRWLYEHDIIELNSGNKEAELVRIVLRGTTWKLVTIESRKEFGIDHLKRARSIRFVSYDFLNPRMFYDPPQN